MFDVFFIFVFINYGCLYYMGVISEAVQIGKFERWIQTCRVHNLIATTVEGNVGIGSIDLIFVDCEDNM